MSESAPGEAVEALPAVFLDRDGVINELAADPTTGLMESPLRVEDVRLLDGAARSIRRLADAGFVLVIVTNQPGAAKGSVDLPTIAAIHARVLSLLAAEGVEIDASRLCLHHPEGVMAELTMRCSCRKPEPGMLLDAAEELDLDLGQSWMIGDSDSDIEAGRRAGCRTVLIEHPASAHRRSASSSADLVAGDLGEAVTMLLEQVGC